MTHEHSKTNINIFTIADKMKLAAKVMHRAEAKTVQFIENFKTIDRYSAEDMIIVLDLNCRDKGLFLEEVSCTNLYSESY